MWTYSSPRPARRWCSTRSRWPLYRARASGRFRPPGRTRHAGVVRDGVAGAPQYRRALAELALVGVVGRQDAGTAGQRAHAARPRALSQAASTGKAWAALGSIGGERVGQRRAYGQRMARRCCHLVTKVAVIVVDGREFVAVTCGPARKIFDLSNACPINPAGWLLPAILIRNKHRLPATDGGARCVCFLWCLAMSSDQRPEQSPDPEKKKAAYVSFYRRQAKGLSARHRWRVQPLALGDGLAHPAGVLRPALAAVG